MTADVNVTFEPCQCHKNFAPVTPTHTGHCCFVPATQTCHPDEVAEWVRKKEGMQ